MRQGIQYYSIYVIFEKIFGCNSLDSDLDKASVVHITHCSEKRIRVKIDPERICIGKVA